LPTAHRPGVTTDVHEHREGRRSALACRR
jgi:hypothetical protein